MGSIRVLCCLHVGSQLTYELYSRGKELTLAAAFQLEYRVAVRLAQEKKDFLEVSSPPLSFDLCSSVDPSKHGPCRCWLS